MKIVHFAPFAPNACGLYEAARDMVVADIVSGHDTHLIDVGTTYNGTFTEGVPGKIDDRGGTKIVSASPVEAMTADVIVAHSGVPDNWIVGCQTPIVWILHGRPGACFRPEQFGNGHSYTLISNLAKWPRVKAMVSFWDCHMKFWHPIIPIEKLELIPAPPVDSKRFSETGTTHDYTAMGGPVNIMLADSWREDVDLYEVANGALEFARYNSGVKFHFYGMENPLRCWEFLIEEFRRFNALGEVWARRPNLEEVYRAADIVLSPNKTATRITAEALSCGTPVIAARGCDLATWTMEPDDPESVASAIVGALNELSVDGAKVRERVSEAQKKISLSEYSRHMNEIYKKVVSYGTDRR